MPNVWYVGRGSKTITSYTWSTWGVVADTTVWNPYNAWSVPHSVLNQAQLDILENDQEFLLGQEGPRQYPRPFLGKNFSESGYAYYKAILDAYLELVDQGVILNELSQLQDLSDIGYDLATAETVIAARNVLEIDNVVVPVRFSTPIAVLGVTASDRAYINRTVISAAMRVTSAPVGSALSVAIQHFDGDSWSTIGALSIPSGSVVEQTTVLSKVQSPGNLLRLNVTSVGSTTPAEGVAVDVVVTNG